jgi:class 3 adenylate cyclase/tetratricopeptide (TPR) repeat protein
MRKTVTIVFCDVSGSTALGERLDPESLRKVLTRYFEAMRTVLERHGGTVEKYIGDAVMAVFGVPQVREDDALRAVRAAAEMRGALADLNKEFERDRGVTIDTRIGVHTGEVMAGDATAGHGFVSGDAANVAARLEQAAGTGEVLMSAETHSLVRDAVSVDELPPLDLKGKAERFRAFRLLDVHPDVAGHVRRMDVPMVGRERELQLLHQVFDRSASERACFLFTLLGAAGVGKSRLAEEFLAGLGDGSVVLRGRCLSYGEGATFFPLAEMVTHAADLSASDAPQEELAKVRALVDDDPDAGRIAAAVLQVIGGRTEGGLTIQENFWSVRRLFESIASQHPLVLVFDDIEWALPTLLDLIDHVAALSRGAPILLLCMARPELLDERPNWGGGKFNATSVLLEPLSDIETGTLVRTMLGGAELDEGLRSRILEAAEGNPLYVEEVLSMLTENGLLVRRERWVATGDVAQIPIPPSVQALLSARLDRLSEPERATLGRAAVIGKVFYEGALFELSSEPERAGVTDVLTSLVRKGLIRPDRSDIGREQAYRFHHLLLRDAAYQTLTKEARADMHERFAPWLEAAMGTRADEGMEVIGYHFEQAYRLRSQLGPLDDRARALAAAAAERLARAGRSARDRLDDLTSLGLFERSIALLPDDSAERVWLLLGAGDALYLQRQVDRMRDVFDRALKSARAVRDERAEGYATLGLAQARLLSDPEGASDEIRRVAREWIPRFEALEDHGGLARVYRALCDTGWLLCQYGQAGMDARTAAQHAREAGETLLQLEMTARLTAAAGYGPAHRDDYTAEVAAFAQAAHDSVGWRFWVLAEQANLAALGDRLAEARELAEKAMAQSRVMGDPRGEMLVETMSVLAALGEDWEVSEAWARRSYMQYEARGDASHRSTQAALLARAAAMQGKVEDALLWADRCDELGSSDDVINQALVREARALAFAGAGRVEEAERLARDAVAIMDATDALMSRADAMLDLAKVFELAGKREDATGALKRAREISVRKGDRARERIASERLTALGGV